MCWALHSKRERADDDDDFVAEGRRRRLAKHNKKQNSTMEQLYLSLATVKEAETIESSFFSSLSVVFFLVLFLCSVQIAIFVVRIIR